MQSRALVLGHVVALDQPVEVLNAIRRHDASALPVLGLLRTIIALLLLVIFKLGLDLRIVNLLTHIVLPSDLLSHLLGCHLLLIDGSI